MKKISCFCLLTYLMAGNAAASIKDYNDEEALTAEFIQRQVNRNMSVGLTIKSMVGHYPQDAGQIVDTALDLYPLKYREIIHGAISAEPAVTEDVVKVAIDKGITQCAEIVEAAIRAEPGYVDFVVNAAAKSTPEELQEIVRVAVVTQPDSADTIVQSLALSHPGKLVEMLQTAVSAVPFVGEYIVDALLAVFPDEAETVVTTAVHGSSEHRENILKIIETARNAGVERKDLEQYALKGGATAEEIAKVYDDN